jgi:nucleoid-associated protein YgaU
VVHTSGVMPYDAQDYPDLRWVIQTLDFDETETIVNDHGNRVRAPVAVSLLQYVTDDRLQDAAFQARALRARRGGGARRRYTVKEGETLVSIARRELGDGGRWPEIAHLNRDLRDPRSVHAGAVINLPR